MKRSVVNQRHIVLAWASVIILGGLCGAGEGADYAFPPMESLGGRKVFPIDNWWNQSVDHLPVDSRSDAIIASIGSETSLHPDFGPMWQGAPTGIPYILIPSDQPRVPVSFQYADESDPGPYPVPPDAPIEGGGAADGDRHVLMIDRDNWVLYELFHAYPEEGGNRWRAGSGAIFDLKTNELRPDGWTSADAAGLPVFPGLVRYDEVVGQGEISQALRFTVRRSRRAYVHPARHYASPHTDVDLPPMGMRVRLKADFDVSGFPEQVQVILRCLKRYGMLLADNGGDWFISGAPDPRWNFEVLAAMKQVKGKDLEVVEMEDVRTGEAVQTTK